MADLRRLLIWGAGGHAKVVADVARACGWEVIAFLDDDTSRLGQLFYGAPIQPPSDLERKSFPEGEAADSQVFVAIGDNAVRERCLMRLQSAGQSIPVLIDPSARISPTAHLGAGTIIMAGAIVQADTRIGCGGIINTGSSVDHDCVLGNCVHVAPGARLTGNVTVGDRSLIGVGAVVIPKVQIAADNTIGAGAAVVRHTKPGQILVGVPASPL